MGKGNRPLKLIIIIREKRGKILGTKLKLDVTKFIAMKREGVECDKIRQVGPHRGCGEEAKKKEKKLRICIKKKKGQWHCWFGMCLSDHYLEHQHHFLLCFIFFSKLIFILNA